MGKKKENKPEDNSWKFEIPLEPKTKKNGSRIVQNKKTGQVYLLPSKAFEEYQKACEEIIPRLEPPIDCQVNVRAIYYMGTKRKVDIANLHSALHDVLVHCGVLADDNMMIIATTDGSKVKYDKKNPRTEIAIKPVSIKTGFE